MNEIAELKRHIDRDGRLIQWPAKRSLQLVALDYLASKFETGKIYPETEVNTLLNQWHTFSDTALLRRELFESGHLNRLKEAAQNIGLPLAHGIGKSCL